jgi:Ser-tRNA(Ala) deacylase AlaX
LVERGKVGTDRLYLTDAYLRACGATVTENDDRGIGLDRTVFHPAGGGQPDDVGRLHWDAGELRVERLSARAGTVLHHAASDGPTPAAGTAVQVEIDWAKRFAYMRAHTMLHLLSGVVYHRFGSGITGGQIYEHRARMDFTLEGFGRPLAEELVAAVNAEVRADRTIEVRFVSRPEAEAIPSLVRVATALPPDVDRIRLIDIRGFDVQADGGTHVRSTREVGEVRLGALENKGARNKRLYLELSPAVTDGTGEP